MTYTFRKAVRSNTSILLALAGASGSGKSYSAIRVARGLVGPKGRVAVIDTEAGRALHYADRFEFDHLDMKPPFSPDAYKGAIVAAEEAGYGAIVIDSMSHEWAGDGGCQDIHDESHRRMGGSDATSVLAWRDAKTAHKKLISRLLQSRSHLIFCLRCEEKIKFSKNAQGKTVIEPAGWMPICEKNFMYEMTVSFLLLDAKPGVGQPIKLQEQHKPCFNLNGHLDEEAGHKLAAWAAGGVTKPEGALGGMPTPPLTEPAVNTEPDSNGTAGAPSPSDDDPAADYCARIRTAHTAKDVQAIWATVPETLQQDVYGDYTQKMKDLARKK